MLLAIATGMVFRQPDRIAMSVFESVAPGRRVNDCRDDFLERVFGDRRETIMRA